MNTIDSSLPGLFRLLLEALAYNAGATWQQWASWVLPPLAVVFVFTEVMARSGAKRSGNGLCILEALTAIALLALVLALLSGRLLAQSGATTQVVAAVVATMGIAAAGLAPLAMLVNRATYATGLVAWLAALGTAAFLIVGGNFGWQLLKPAVVTVVSFTGAVEHRPSPLQSWISLTATNVALPVGTVFRTGPGASTRLQAGTATSFTVQPDSELAVRLSKGQPLAVLRRGKLAGELLPDGKSRFHIRTPAATSGILGTRFLVQSDAEHTTTTTVAEGTVAVRGRVTDSPEVSVKTGQAVTVKLGSPPGDPQSAAPADLAEIESVFPKRVGFVR